VDNNHVTGWDDPRMPTIAGLRRRGFTPASIRDFCDRIGVTKADNSIEMGVLENCIREDLNEIAPRRMAVLNPLKVVIENYPEDQVEQLDAPNHPQKEEMGNRSIPFSREVYIDRDDFREEANKKYKRLVLGKEVRLRNAYVIKAEQVIKDDAGEIIEIRCSYDTETLNKNPADGRKVKGVIHWVSASHGVEAEVRLYDRLFNHANPEIAAKEGKEFTDYLNTDSLVTLSECVVEANLESVDAGERFQFEREGYFCRDTENSENGKPVFNRTVTLRDTWSKIESAS
ncbi:MAG: glutamate--tRNA ligase family protein, partial [Gammaproteobacteria bacterium]|nr:glutamate--tRNA ligase family protein [Gammaproteobacteria bacterium]